MATFEFVLPELGEGIEAGDIVQVRVAVGDTVVKEQTIVFELETDKAVVEVPSPESGTVTAIHVHPGDNIKVGQRLLTLEMAQAAVAVAPEAPRAVPAAHPANVHPLWRTPAERPEPSAAISRPASSNVLSQEPAGSSAAVASCRGIAFGTPTGP